MPASGHIAASEVADHADLGKLGKQCRVADLHGEATSRLVADGLAMAADGADGAWRKPLACEQVANAFGCQAGPAVLGQGGAGNLVRAAGAKAQQALAQVGGHGDVMSSEQCWLLALFDQGDVQAIEAGTGHHPQIKRHDSALVRSEHGGLFLIHAGDQWLALLHEA